MTENDMQHLQYPIGPYEPPTEISAVHIEEWIEDLAELPYRRVAHILEIEVSTARLYRRRAIIRLAALLSEEGMFWKWLPAVLSALFIRWAIGNWYKSIAMPAAMAIAASQAWSRQ